MDRDVDSGPLWDPLEGPWLHDSEEQPTFEHSATLRIFADSLNFDEISARLGLVPSSVHRKGDRPLEGSTTVFIHDMWSYSPSVPEDRPLQEHIDALWEDIEGASDYLLSLKGKASVDVFLGYRSDWVDGGVDVPHRSLEMFTRLEIPFSLSIVRI